ncbi:ATP-binding cassette domain-containing protein [Microbacterium sp.]
MPDGQVLEFTHVTKRFNDVTAVSDFSARVEPGVVTAFLGPNGAGKTTTLRILLGQVRATSGTATIGGVSHAELRHPLRTIGSVLEETAYRPRRSASRQLTIAAKANGIPLSRVEEVLSLVGLEHEAEGRIGSFSLGMRQRLSVAHALLGDPGALVFDEPANGLDPEGIRWIRLLLRRLADEGRTVLVSSHVLSEIEQVADHVLVLSKGQLVLSSGIETLADPSAGSVVVDAADRAALKSALSAAGLEVEVLRSGLTVRGSNAGAVGAIAASAGIALATLVQRGPTLEDVFIELVRGGRLAPQAITAAPVDSAAPVADVGAPVVDSATPSESSDVADSDHADSETLQAQDVAGSDVSESDAAATDADASVLSESDADATDAARAEADAADAEADDAADAADAARDVEYAAAELRYAADASDANDAEDAADVASEAAHAGREEAYGDDDPAGGSTEPQTPADAEAANAQPSFDDILFGTAPADALDAHAADDTDARVSDDTDGHVPDATDPTANEDGTGEHSGVEFFAEAHESDESHDSDESSDDATAEASGDDDPRSAAVTSMLAAAARAYYEDEPKDYPLGEVDASAEAETEADAAPEANDGREGEHHEGQHHEQHEGQHHEHHEDAHHEHHEGEHDHS